MREHFYKHTEEYLKLPYEFLNNHPQNIVPEWMQQINENDEFQASEDLSSGYRLIDPELMADRGYPIKTPSRLFLDYPEIIYSGGIYKMLRKSLHPDYVIFNKHKIKAPQEIDLTVIEPVLLPPGARYIKNVIGFLNQKITSPSTL